MQSCTEIYERIKDFVYKQLNLQLLNFPLYEPDPKFECQGHTDPLPTLRRAEKQNTLPRFLKNRLKMLSYTPQISGTVGKLCHFKNKKVDFIK